MERVLSQNRGLAEYTKERIRPLIPLAKNILKYGARLVIPTLLVILTASQRTESITAAIRASDLNLDGKNVPPALISTAPQISSIDSQLPRTQDIAASDTVFHSELPGGRILEVDNNDWSQEEAKAFSQVIPKDLQFFEEIFGSTQKFLKKINIVRLTEKQKALWGWTPDMHEGTNCDPSSGVCTVWVDTAPSTVTGQYNSARQALTHGLTHVWIGGYARDSNEGENNGTGYMFEFINNSGGSLVEKPMSAMPRPMFEEESLCFLMDDLIETQVWKSAIPNASNFAQDYRVKALQIDRKFFQKIRDQIDIYKTRGVTDLNMDQLAQMVKNVNPKVAEILHW